jgi:ketosteroid isomerase-like protein
MTSVLRRMYPALVLALLASPPAAAQQPDDAGRAELMAADREFATLTAAEGIDGWMAYMADDAVRLQSMGGPALRGPEEIRKADGPLFADPARRLAWEPVDGGAFADGRHGFTTGRYKVLERQADGTERVLGEGSYVTLWRRDEASRWLVILDTGAADAPAQQAPGTVD